eukprot:TRINITY_DN9413_c0_g1_i1.p1 TRINITY_DN9413_c0_g1~~TRINITY_DN9413_c0_g1_i1.p1  ORF type:complete len:136 (+),score=39.96 TRINITY_DN9413_c0_g1_i1:110-517(+)
MEALGVDIPPEDLRQAFDMLDIDESGELTIQEFIEGVSQLQESLNTKHVVSLDYSLQRVQVKLTKRLDSLEETVKTGNETLAKSIDELCAGIEKLNKNIEGLRDGRKAKARPSPSPQGEEAPEAVADSLRKKPHA